MNQEQDKAVIAIIDDDEDIVEVTSAFLMRHGYKILKAHDGPTGLALIKDMKPDLILLDLMLPKMDGHEVCRRIKEDSHLWHVPVIYFTARGALSEKISGLTGGADDYITKPFEPRELLARIQGILSRITQVLDANPLTKLPGNHSIQLKISQTLNIQEPFAICHIDIDNFKSFNDQYGFQRGDIAIRTTGQILIAICKKHGSSNHFVGHIGGDDFVIVSTPEKIDGICEEIIQQFNTEATALYDKEDQERGYITIKDRRGNLREFPLMSLSMAIITNEKRKINHIAEINAIATELKKYAKSLPGSNYVKDRRKDDPSEVTTIKTSGDQETLTEQKPLLLDEFAHLFKEKKLNVLLHPINNCTNQTLAGYEAIAHGLSKNQILKQDEIFTQAVNLQYVKEVAQLYFKKINIFFYGLQSPLWITGWLHPKVLEEILVSDPACWDGFKINPSFIIQIRSEDLLRYDKIMEKVTQRLQERSFSISIIPPPSGALPLSTISKIKPKWIYIKEDIYQMWKSDPNHETLLKALTDMAHLFGGEIIISGVDNKEDIIPLQQLGIQYMSGNAFGKPLQEKE